MDAVVRDVDYIGGADYADGKDLLDVYMPEGAENVPVIVFFHGGALRFGTKNQGRSVAARLVPQGIGIVAANYRLSPVFQHPAHIDIEYDGSEFNGWQVQPDAPSVQQCVEQALGRVADQPIETVCAGRTDSGVHALNFTANFKSSAENFKTPEKWRIALNAVLPADIIVKYAQIVSPEFHARHSAIG